MEKSLYLCTMKRDIQDILTDTMKLLLKIVVICWCCIFIGGAIAILIATFF